MGQPLPSSETNSTTTDPDTTIFYALGDAPYNESQAVTLREQIANLPDDAEFIVHLGDMHRAGDDEYGINNGTCLSEDYEEVRRIFRLSSKPVLIVIGDNDANDCLNADQARLFWDREFSDIPETSWSIPYQIHRRKNHSDQYHFIHKDTLFLALQLIGGNVTDPIQRNEELLDQWYWAEAVIEQYRIQQLSSVAGTGRVVMFAHSDPHSKHDAFFDPFKLYYAVHQAQLALLYLNGDRHEWDYEDQFLGFRNAKQITVSGEAVDPLLKIMIHNVENRRDEPFEYDRRLDAEL
jgi:hypothetical protein